MARKQRKSARVATLGVEAQSSHASLSPSEAGGGLNLVPSPTTQARRRLQRLRWGRAGAIFLVATFGLALRATPAVSPTGFELSWSSDESGILAEVPGEAEEASTGAPRPAGVGDAYGNDAQTTLLLSDEDALARLSLAAMKVVDATVSPVRARFVAQLLARVALQVLASDEERLYWIALIGRESKFNGRAVSKSGAVGLGQLVPKYAKDFGIACGLTDLAPEDLQDDQVNAYLSACYFKRLVDRHHGSIPLALVSYNAGPNSKDIHAFRKLESVNHESANYVSSVWFIGQNLLATSGLPAGTRPAPSLSTLLPEVAPGEVPLRQGTLLAR